MSLDRFHYELRLLSKAVWLTPVLVVLGLTLLIAIANHNITPISIARALGGSLEILLPMAAGIVVATVGTHDRAIELQLTMPRKYHRTANMRFLFILLWSAIVSVLTSFLLSASNHWRLPVEIADWSDPGRFLTWQLTWLASTLWLVALGLVLSLVIRSRAASGALICVLSFAELVWHGDFNSDPHLHPFYLFPLTFNPEALYWLTNRFELLGMAVVLFVMAWFLLRAPDLLLSHAPGEE